VADPCLHLRLPAIAGSARTAREFIHSVLADAAVPPDLARDVVIATGELVANAIVHAYRPPRPGGELQLDMLLSAGSVTVTVRDFGAGMRPHLDDYGAGLGLSIAGALANRLIVSRDPIRGMTEVAATFTLLPPNVLVVDVEDGIPTLRRDLADTAAGSSEAVIHDGQLSEE
jgi:anti-sigma regulatory factor (Ser/Thr protein kinase)